MQPKRRGNLDGTSSDNGMEQRYSIKGQQTHIYIYICNDTAVDSRADKTYRLYMYIYCISLSIYISLNHLSFICITLCKSLFYTFGTNLHKKIDRENDVESTTPVFIS